MLPAKRILSLTLILVLTSLSGCTTPFLTLPGRALQGEPAITDSFAFARQYKLLQLEVNPSSPYSVWLRTTLIGNDLYIDAAPSRRWHSQLQSDNRVRIKLGEKIYPATAIITASKDITRQFLAGRIIYRIEPTGL